MQLLSYFNRLNKQIQDCLSSTSKNAERVSIIELDVIINNVLYSTQSLFTMRNELQQCQQLLVYRTMKQQINEVQQLVQDAMLAKDIESFEKKVHAIYQKATQENIQRKDHIRQFIYTILIAILFCTCAYFLYEFFV